MKNYDKFLEAKVYIKKKKYKEAIYMLRKLHIEEPYDNIIKFELARMLTRFEDTLNEGYNYLLELLSTPSWTYAMLELGRLEASRGNYEEAKSYFTKLVYSESQNKTYAMFELGRLEASRGNYEEAKSYFTKLLETSSKTYAMFELGRLEASVGNYEEAKAYFTKLIYSESQNKTYAMFELGRLEASRGNYEEAKSYFTKLLETSSKTYAMLELGRLEAIAGNYEEAKTCFTELIYSESQNKTYAMFELGKLEASVGNYEEAKTCFTELIQTPDWIYAIQELLFLAIKEENYEEASQLLNTIYNANLMEDNQLSNITFYLKYKLNLLTENDKEQNKNYFCLQLLDYNREAAINHIKAHLDENGFKRLHSVFFESTDIENIFPSIEKSISEAIPEQSNFTDKYKVDCDYVIGVNNGVETSCVEVITFPNTKDIITMYPIIDTRKKSSRNDVKRLVYDRKN